MFYCTENHFRLTKRCNSLLISATRHQYIGTIVKKNPKISTDFLPKYSLGAVDFALQFKTKL